MFIDYATTPIQIRNENSDWVCTYRYEPFLKKWFYITPDMKRKVIIMDTDDIPEEVLEAAEKREYEKCNSYCSPVKMQIQLNRTCNYQCKICYAYKDELLHSQIEYDTLEKYLDHLSAIGVLRINYVGGEAFMRKDFPDIVEMTHKKGMLVSCITNGIIPGMNIEKYKPVLQKMFSVQISCNGFENTYEHEYGGANWERAKKCIENVIRSTKANTLSYTITENNYVDICNFIEFAKTIRPTVVKFGTVSWNGKASKYRTTKYYKDIIPYALQMINECREKYPEMQIQCQIDKGMDTPLWEAYMNDYRPFEMYFSPEGHDSLYLSASGEVYPFPLLSDKPELMICTIDDDLEKKWQTSKVLNDIRRVTFENSECARVGCKKVCGLWNRSYAYSWSGNFFGKVPCERTNWE